MKKIKYLFIILLFIIIYIIFSPVLMHKAYTREQAIKDGLEYINENFSNEIKYKNMIKLCKKDKNKCYTNFTSSLVYRYLNICYSKNPDYDDLSVEIRKLCNKDVKKEYLESYLKLISYPIP